jgi:hypothetical protein
MHSVFEFEKLLHADSKVEFIVAWEKIFNRTLSKNFYNWIFNKNNNIFVARRNGVIVSGYCLLEIDIFFLGEKRRGLLCNNVFVDGYANSKLGVFRLITEYALGVLSQSFELGLGFPNEKAINSHLRAGWSNPFTLKFLEFSLHSSPINSINNDRCFTVPVNSDNLDIVLDSFRALDYLTYSAYVVKSIEYIKWRFIDNPRYSYVISGVCRGNRIRSFVISKYFKNALRVHAVDYAFESSSDVDVLISEIVSYYKNINVDFGVIDLWASDEDATHLLPSGFKDVGREQPVIINYLSDKSDVRSLSRPHFVLSDNDVY